MPNAKPTKPGNVNVQTEVVNRSKGSTYIVTDEPDGQNQAITREEASSGPRHRTPTSRSTNGRH